MNAFARLRRSRRAATVGLAVTMVATVGGLAAYAATPPPAHLNNTVGLKQVGPIDETNGFPLWYKDTNNVRLELCLDPSDANCIMGDLPHPGQPVSFPDNFPDEGFWSNTTATLDAGGGDKALLVTGVEAAFGTADGLPAAAAARSASAGSGSVPPAWSTARRTPSRTRTASTTSMLRSGPSRASTPPRTSVR